MSTFSEGYSNDEKFYLKLEYVEDKPSKLIINVQPRAGESATVSDLADAIYNKCFGGDFGEETNSFGLNYNIENLPCEIRHGIECRDIHISWFSSYKEILYDIASQISI